RWPTWRSCGASCAIPGTPGSGGLWPGLEHQLSDDFFAEYLSGRSESQPQVEALGAATTLSPRNGQALLAAASRLCRDRLNGEPAVAAALLIGRDVQPPDARPERFDLVLGVEAAHDEPDDAIIVLDEPGPRGAEVDVRLSDGLSDSCDIFP